MLGRAVLAAARLPSLRSKSVVRESVAQFAMVVYHPPKAAPSEILAKARVPNPSQRIAQELPALLARLKVQFKDETLARQSLVHYTADSTTHNARLAGYGASIIEYVVSLHLYQHYPNLLHFSMREIAWHMNSPAVLTTVAKTTGIDALVDFQAPENSKSDLKNYAIADSLRAFIGAVALDSGLETAHTLTRDLILPVLTATDVTSHLHFQHPKLTLTRILQAQDSPSPVCKILKETGRLSHLPTFLVGVFVRDQLLAEGAGFSIKQAEREAVCNALRAHFGTALKTLPLPQDMPPSTFVPEHAINLFPPAESSEAPQGRKRFGKKQKKGAAEEQAQ